VYNRNIAAVVFWLPRCANS